MTDKKGFVSLVGAGPGDTGLITQKGLNCISEADVILFDRLVNPRLLREAKDECEFIYCGKLPNNHVMRQEMIHRQLVELAQQGKYVVRLKGGDPSVFGRVGEEAEELVKNDIPYEWIPGITSSIATAAYAGIPVTHRKYSNSFTMRTGHDCALNEGARGAGQHLGDTIAYYMGVKNVQTNCEKLIAQGKSKDTKAVMIQWGTHGKQKVVEGTLETIADVVRESQIENPAMMIIGDVVSLRDSLAWFEKKRFSRKHIIIAKSGRDDFKLERHFSEQGAEAYSFPLFQQKRTELDITKVVTSESIMFASPESADVLFEQLCIERIDIRDLPRKIVCRSSKTMKLLAEKGIIAEMMSEVEDDMLIIAPVGYQIEGRAKNICYTHEMIIDGRFKEINERILMENKWETVIFPNKAAVDMFIKESTYFEHLNELSFAYIGESVKEYAMKRGFAKLDEEVQRELDRKVELQNV